MNFSVTFYTVHHIHEESECLYLCMNIALNLCRPLSCALEFNEDHYPTFQKKHPVGQTLDELGQQLNRHPSAIVYVPRQLAFKYLLASLVLLHGF